MLLALLPLLFIDVQPPPAMWSSYAACGSSEAELSSPCTVPTMLSAAEAARRLGSQDHVWWIEGDLFTMVARPTTEPWILTCCSLQTGLVPISNSGLATISIRVPRLREAILQIATTPSDRQPVETYRGPDADKAPARVDNPATITTYHLPSRALGESRRVTVFVPSGTRENAKLPVFYLADGASRAFAGIAAALVRDRRAKPAILVGIDAAPDKPDCEGMGCDRRGPEYVAEFGPPGPESPYERHLRFITQEVVPYVEAHYPASHRREDRVIGGYSNGGVWAATTAARFPHMFGNVLVMSAGAKSAESSAGKLRNSRVFAGAGIYETDFRKTTIAAVDAAKAGGAETRFREVVGGHAMSTWDLIFADAYLWFLPS